MFKTREQFPAAAFDDAPAQPAQHKAAPAQPPSPPAMPAAGMGGNERMARLMNPELIKEEMRALVQSGALPAGFDPAEAMKDPAFMQALIEMPAKYAIRVYLAEKRAADAEAAAMQKIAARMQTQRSLPRPARAEAAGSPARDYANMSDEDFRAVERYFKEQMRKGIRTRL